MAKNNDSEVKKANRASGLGKSSIDIGSQQAAPKNVTGRGVFVIDTVPAGVAVRTAFLAEDGRLIDIPAVFPNLMYALDQIEELKQLVAQRFSEAAKIGNQVIAQQIEVNRTQDASRPDSVAVDKSTDQAESSFGAPGDSLQ